MHSTLHTIVNDWASPSSQFAFDLGTVAPGMLHTGVTSEYVPIVIDDAERLRLLRRVCQDDLSKLAGLNGSVVGSRALQLLLGSRVRRFARAMATFNSDIAQQGVKVASRRLCARYGGRIVADGAETVPTSGPVLFAANHPGLMDTVAVYGSVPRPDIRALARPQPLLTLLSELAPNLLMLPDDGPNRASGLREVLRTLRAGGALLIFPAGTLEPEPTLLPSSASLASARRNGSTRHASLPHALLPPSPLGEWSSGVGTLVRLAVRQDIELQVVPTAISGVLSTATWRRFAPLVRLRRAHRGREDLTAVLQLAFPTLGPTTVRVRYGPPLAASTLASDGASAEAITARVRAAVARQLRASRH